MSTLAKYPKATTITIYSLGIFLGLLHVFLGSTALTPFFSQDYHRELKINYNAFSKILTFLHSFVDKAVLAYYLRLIFASFQIVFGAMLIENNRFGSIGNVGLILVDFVVLTLQLLIGTAYERIAPTIVFSILLIARLLIIEQSKKKSKVGVKTRNAGKPKSSTPKKNKNE